ncbi:MAG: aminotransferase class III-fold pyridoxal phosphate-dependent enzyme, partial [Deltaproteobacteria bacterium]|nr:aminotransferase class III-fold pyridoxal phosphate-dependent enzyme [Deltaproteobacteria bacterium]
HQHYQVKPQILTLAKSLGVGLPIGACLCTQGVADTFWTGAHGSTYGGNPLVSRVAHRFLQILTEEGLLERAAKQGVFLQQGLQKLAQSCDLVDHVRGLGLMAGIALKVESKPVMRALLEKGLIVNAVQEKALRLLPPLTVSEEEISEALFILEEVLKG